MLQERKVDCHQILSPLRRERYFGDKLYIGLRYESSWKEDMGRNLLKWPGESHMAGLSPLKKF